MAIVVALGGQAGARLAHQEGLCWSPSTLLNLLRDAPFPSSEPTRILGVDDFAFKRGQRYGTILVDLEKRRPIDLLDGREAKPLEAWLEGHPGITILCRDRWRPYASAAARAAPQARQVVDRWHLRKNLSEVLERILITKENLIAKAFAHPKSRATTSREKRRDSSSKTVTKIATVMGKRQRNKLRRYRAVQRLKKEGQGIRAISRRLHLSRRTVRNYFYMEKPPPHCPKRRTGSILDSYHGFLRERWQEGCHNASQLWRELRSKGYAGSPTGVRHYVRSWRASKPRTKGSTNPSRKRPVPKPAQVARMLTRSPAHLSEHEHRGLDRLLSFSPSLHEAVRMARRLVLLFKKKRGDLFDFWLAKTKEVSEGAMARFAKHLAQDAEAVRAAIELPWSNGQTEGQVNRLKKIKRDMYGRASLKTLKARLLLEG